MVGHQTVSVNFTSQLDFPFPEIIKVIQVITISSKHHLSVVTALNDVVRTVWQNYSGSTWHKKTYHPLKGLFLFLCTGHDLEQLPALTRENLEKEGRRLEANELSLRFSLKCLQKAFVDFRRPLLMRLFALLIYDWHS